MFSHYIYILMVIEVYGIDTGFYENNTLTKPFTNYKSFKKDIRNLEKKDIDNFDAVIHLLQYRTIL